MRVRTSNTRVVPAFRSICDYLLTQLDYRGRHKTAAFTAVGRSVGELYGARVTRACLLLGQLRPVV